MKLKIILIGLFSAIFFIGSIFSAKNVFSSDCCNAGDQSCCSGCGDPGSSQCQYCPCAPPGSISGCYDCWCPPGGCTNNECSGPNDCPGGCCKGGVCQSGAICSDSFCPENRESIAEPWPPSGNITCDELIANCSNYQANPSLCRVFCLDNGIPSIKNGTWCESFPGYTFRQDCSLWTCEPICSLTAPGITSIVPDPDQASAVINWNPGTGSGAGGIQELYVGEVEAEVNSGCPGNVSPACVVKEEALPNTVSVYNTFYSGNNLTVGTVYYVKIVNFKNDTCESTDTDSFVSSCTLDPAVASLSIGGTQAFQMLTSYSTAITRVDFSSSAGGVASVAPATDDGTGDGTYITTATGVSNGAATLTGEVIMNGGTVCTDTADITVNGNAGAWWQAQSGNVHADAGSVVSSIPATATNPYLILQIGANDTGLVSFTGSADVGSGTINEDGNEWQAQTQYRGVQTGFSYFERLLADDPEAAANGVVIQEGDYSTGGAISVANGENMILLVNGNVTIDNNINVVPGGFLAIIASGDIIVVDGVDNVEGVLIADGTINFGSGDQQLTAEGIFTGWSGITLARELTNNNLLPAEKFIYRPDLQLNAYQYLLWLGINWKEVAP